MKARILLVCVLVAAPVFAPAASKEIQELQRDIALLQQQIKDLQRSQDEKFASVTELARQSIEAANRANTGVAVIQSNLDKSIQSTRDSVGVPLAATTTRMKEISENLSTLTQAVSDLTSSLNRMQTQLTDIKQQLAVMTKPPDPPSVGQGGTAPGTGGPAGGAVSSAPCPTGSASSAYDQALKDYRSGKSELGVSEFMDYLRCFPATDLAPNAQFYIAYFYYGQKNFEDAVKAFDVVLERFPENNKTPDALLYKGRALAQMGRKTDGAAEWKQLIQRFPRSEPAKAACDDLKGFGLNCPTVPNAAPKKGTGRKK